MRGAAFFVMQFFFGHSFIRIVFSYGDASNHSFSAEWKEEGKLTLRGVLTGAEKTINLNRDNLFPGLTIAPKRFLHSLLISIHRSVSALEHQIDCSVVRRQLSHANRGGIPFPRLFIAVFHNFIIALFQGINQGMTFS
jgi:hypothetical protein